MSPDPTCSNNLHHEIILHTAAIQTCLKQIDKAARECRPALRGIRVDSPDVVASVFRVGWHPKLIEILSWLYGHYPGRIVLTCGHRKSKWTNRPDVHNTDLLRAGDLRSREFPNPEVVEAWINQNWDYGKEPYQVCKYHRSARCKCGNVFGIDTRKGLIQSQTCPSCAADYSSLVDLGPHFHIQVRNETVFIGA